MSSRARYGDNILATIDQLRKRKSRPDLDRICHMVERHHGLSADEVRADLAQLVAEELVIKVDYKGNTSYRNAAKWRRRRRERAGGASSAGGGPGFNERSSEWNGRRVLKAVRSLTKICGGDRVDEMRAENAKGDARKNDSCGVDIEQIEQWLAKKWSDKSNTKETLQAIIVAELNRGRLQKLANGHFVARSYQSCAAVLPKKTGRKSQLNQLKYSLASSAESGVAFRAGAKDFPSTIAAREQANLKRMRQVVGNKRKVRTFYDD